MVHEKVTQAIVFLDNGCSKYTSTYVTFSFNQVCFLSRSREGGLGVETGYFLLHSDLETIQIIKERFRMKSLEEIVCFMPLLLMSFQFPTF